MRIDALPDGVRLYGDASYRGTCPLEDAEQEQFFKHLRAQYPKSWAVTVFHPRNEGDSNRKGAELRRAAAQRAQGMVPGTADIIGIGNPTFVCEMKRRDRTQSALSAAQYTCLQASAEAGAFVCVALGYKAAWQAFGDWLEMQANK